jgi:hypothetical protein
VCAERTATAVPKRVLVDRIVRVIPEESIRVALHIAADTSLKQRLHDFTKAKLLALITSTPEGEQALDELERDYPLSSPPTLYLVKVQYRPEVQDIVLRTTVLADAGRPAGVDFGEDRPVRVVYTARPAYAMPFNQETTEIPLLYERRLEYTICDPDSDEYGKRRSLYSLERAFIWIVERYSHAIACCSDFVAVRPILDFARQCLELRWALPDLTEEMLNRLAADSNPRSATFYTPDAELAALLDVRSVTVSDPQLGDRGGFQQICHDPGREQTAGFYSSHPDLVFGGLGIARRYGRIWTPAHLSRSSLVTLAIGLIGKTEQELSREYGRNLDGYVHYFRNILVTVGDHRLRGKERDTFNQLVVGILEAAKRDSREIAIDRELLHALVEYQKPLGLTTVSEFECPECGSVVGQCPDCHLPYRAKMDGPDLVFECLNTRCRQRLNIAQGFECDCGQEVHLIAPENHLQVFPSPKFMRALREFLDALDDVTWKGLFYVNGFTLKLLPLPTPPSREIVHLDDLRLWRVRARYHVRGEPAESRRESLTRILRKAKEKCHKNNGHPTHQVCEQCLAGRVLAEDVKACEVCLPRMLGLAIAEDFDGVHHGYEIADVKYSDVLDDDALPVRVGVHLKSRTRQRVKGLGRSVRLIKGLYTQLFYSAYLVLSGRAKFDIIGISVPNTINEEVTTSMQLLVNELGFPFLIIDERDWLKIVDAVLEQLEMEQHSGDQSFSAEPPVAGAEG